MARRVPTVSQSVRATTGAAYQRNGISLMITALILGIAALLSLIVALVATWLSCSGGMIIQKAIMCGGGAFGATMTLLVIILSGCGVLPRS